MSGRRTMIGGDAITAAVALCALEAATGSIRPRHQPAPQSPENADAQRTAAEEKRRRKNAKRLSPVNPPAKEA